jgi:hypothetical protein
MENRLIKHDITRDVNTLRGFIQTLIPFMHRTIAEDYSPKKSVLGFRGAMPLHVSSIYIRQGYMYNTTYVTYGRLTHLILGTIMERQRSDRGTIHGSSFRGGRRGFLYPKFAAARVFLGTKLV